MLAETVPAGENGEREREGRETELRYIGTRSIAHTQSLYGPFKLHKFVGTYVHTGVCTHVPTCAYTHKYAYIHTYIHVYIYMI